MRVALVLLAFALAACAGPIDGRSVAPTPQPIGPEATVRIAEAGAGARRFAEHVAARCLLDGVVRGAAMVVDRQTGRVIIVGDTGELLAIDFLPADGGSRLRLSGPAMAEPAMRQQILFHIDRAARTGDTACPMLA